MQVPSSHTSGETIVETLRSAQAALHRHHQPDDKEQHRTNGGESWRPGPGNGKRKGKGKGRGRPPPLPSAGVVMGSEMKRCDQVQVQGDGDDKATAATEASGKGTPDKVHSTQQDKPAEVETDKPAAGKEEASGQRRDLLVKWKGRSYIHCTWVPEPTLMAAADKVGAGSQGTSLLMEWQ